MKLSVSLSESDLTALDDFVRSVGLPSRSAGVQRAVRMLRHVELEQQYQAAWEEWDSSGEQSLWDAAAADGLPDAAR